MCLYIKVFSFLQTHLQQLSCLSSNNGAHSKRMLFKFFVQITLTFFLTQVLNCAFDDFIFVGFAQIFGNIFSAKKPKLNAIQKLNQKIMPGVSFFSNAKTYAIPVLRVFLGKQFIFLN
jgi:hypothetical protein